MAYLLGVHFEYGLEGMWVGYGFGAFFLCFTYFSLIYNANWDKISDEAQSVHLDETLDLTNDNFVKLA